MAEEDLDSLIALLETPDPPRKLSGWLARSQQFQKFLADCEIRRGRSVGVEVAALYRFYRAWCASFTPPLTPYKPFEFAHRLSRHGFRKIRKIKTNGRERRCLGMSRESAARLHLWLQENPMTDADYSIFDPKTRWTKHSGSK